MKPHNSNPAVRDRLLRCRKTLMQSSSMDPRRNDDHHNTDRGNGDDDSAAPEILVPDPQVWKEFNVSSMTLARWTADPALGFPPRLKINGRNFRYVAFLKSSRRTFCRKRLQIAPAAPSELNRRRINPRRRSHVG